MDSSLKGIIERYKNVKEYFIFTRTPIYSHYYEEAPYFKAYIKEVDNNGILIQSPLTHGGDEDIYIPFSNIVQITFSFEDDLRHVSH